MVSGRCNLCCKGSGHFVAIGLRAVSKFVAIGQKKMKKPRLPHDNIGILLAVNLVFLTDRTLKKYEFLWYVEGFSARQI